MKAGAIEFLTKPPQHDVLLNVIRDAIEQFAQLSSSSRECER